MYEIVLNMYEITFLFFKYQTSALVVYIYKCK